MYSLMGCILYNTVYEYVEGEGRSMGNSNVLVDGVCMSM